jgi:hypothetical protein
MIVGAFVLAEALALAFGGFDTNDHNQDSEDNVQNPPSGCLMSSHYD